MLATAWKSIRKFILPIIFIVYCALIYIPISINLLSSPDYESSQYYEENQGKSILDMSEDDLTKVGAIILLRDELMDKPALIIRMSDEEKAYYEKNITLDRFDTFFETTLSTYMDKNPSLMLHISESIKGTGYFLTLPLDPDLILKDIRKPLDIGILSFMSAIFILLMSYSVGPIMPIFKRRAGAL